MSNEQQQPTLSDVLAEVQATRKEVRQVNSKLSRVEEQVRNTGALIGVLGQLAAQKGEVKALPGEKKKELTSNQKWCLKVAREAGIDRKFGPGALQRFLKSYFDNGEKIDVLHCGMYFKTGICPASIDELNTFINAAVKAGAMAEKLPAYLKASTVNVEAK